MTGSSSAPTPNNARRLAAALIDGLVAAILIGVFGVVPLLGTLAGGVYLVARDGVEMGPMRFRSVGKHVMGLGLVRVDGRPLTLETSVLRNWMFGLGAVAGVFGTVPLPGGFLAPFISLAGMALFLYELYNVLSDPTGRRWGDRLGNTKVVESTGLLF